MFPECLHSRVLFLFQGKQWPLLFTHRVLLACEERTGVDMLAANLGNPSAGLIRALLYGALERAGASCTIDQVGRLITGRSLRSIRGSVLQAWVVSMPDPKPAIRAKGDDSESKSQPKLTWLKAWAEATSRDGLGLSDEQWQDQTPRQTGALQDLRLEQMRREEMLGGIIASTVANYGYRAPDKPRTSESFMIHRVPEELQPQGLQDAAPGCSGDYIMNQMKKMKR